MPNSSSDWRIDIVNFLRYFKKQNYNSREIQSNKNPFFPKITPEGKFAKQEEEGKKKSRVESFTQREKKQTILFFFLKKKVKNLEYFMKARRGQTGHKQQKKALHEKEWH